MPVLDKGVARGDFEAYIGADNTFGINWQEFDGAEWKPKNLTGWGGRFEIWSLDKSTLLYAQQGNSGENGFEVTAGGRVQVTVPREVFEKDEWLQRGTVMYKLYAIPPKYNLNSLFVTRDDVYENFCTLQECQDHINELKKLIEAEAQARKDGDTTLTNALNSLKTRVNNFISDITSKIWGGVTVGSDGHINWGKGKNDWQKIPMADLNIFSTDNPTNDTVADSIRSRDVIIDDDVKIH